MDARHVLLTAERFRRAAIKLEGIPNTPDYLSDIHLAIPRLVNLAFATEIYLKFLIITKTTEPNPRGHKLDLLYSKLPAKLQAEIKVQWENMTPNEMEVRAVRVVKSGITSPTFEISLADSASCFEALRYAYEDPQQIKLFDGDIMEAIRRIIFRSFPTEYADVRLPLPRGVLPPQQKAGVAERKLGKLFDDAP
ncbi:hypothetical protein HFO94_30260 [Rhizobium leguminosarum]|uniref:hypothetical protein n=1 Tax=Rhizobium TaxID=379 RepID=UPI001478FE53|nr:MULTISPECIES: hypothetical protein [Rhizobium]MBY5357746.1 hypothetical protein [Rhizobium leguminosarum]NNG74124.1 hypothetical protein [Rhizobium laguerreae]NNH45649.1 hypothetical protein [Rhizobium laguerreae]